MKIKLFLVLFIVFFSVSALTNEQSSNDKTEIELTEQELAEICNCENENIASERFPTLDQNQLDDDSQERKIWPSPLPFFAQEVIDLGFDLPLPFGVSIVPNSIRQDVVLKDLQLGINGSDLIDLDFVELGTGSITNRNVQFMVDAWIFPFLNVFVTYGKMSGDGEIPLQFAGSDLLGQIGIECGKPISPAACEQNFTSVAKPMYDGNNVSIGFNLAMGWDKFFVTMPVTYAVTDVDLLDENATALHISPRIGMSSDAGERGVMSTFFGFTYLVAEFDAVGEFSIDMPNIPNVPETLDAKFVIHQKNKDRINYMIGFNWDITKNWSIHSEAGFGNSRENFVASVGYRF